MRRDKLDLAILAIGTLVATGLARDSKADLLDDFRKADVPRRLELLPRLAKELREDELPPEARFLAALQLLRPHLTWSAPSLIRPADEKVRELAEKQRQYGDDRWRWGEAVGAETWMLADVPAEIRATARKALAAWKDDRLKEPTAANFTWHLHDAKHADVAEAVRLLLTITEGDQVYEARRWVDAIRRNNTVLTLDVTGSHGAGKPAPVVLDIRNAERVTCKLYRVRKPEDLLWVTGRIGTDFLFRDHGLQYGLKDDLRRENVFDEIKRATKAVLDKDLGENPVPEALRKDPVWTSESAVAELKMARLAWWDHRDHYDQDREYRAGDGGYFRDSCDRFRDRLDKTYRPAVGRWSSWQCDRIVEVPGKAVAEAGAYVLAVEAHGQVAYAPIVVEPLSLTMRRCRDGVMTVVADTEGKKPVAGATIHGRNMLGTAETDAEGVAFARLHAGGDRAVIVHKDGRFAIGGFGRVFEGIYWWPAEQHERFGRYGKEAEAKESNGIDSLVRYYSDRYVVAAYTDRPTYRPGQEMQFKLIVRRLATVDEKKDRPRSFRSEEFDLAARMEVPQEKSVPFDLLDPIGRVVSRGELTLNDFGTAAGKATLSSEAAVGAYSLRLHLGNRPRMVLDFCSVEYYRLPTFRLDIKGVPEKVKQPAELRLELSGEYYFGKPLAGGKVEVRLTAQGSMRRLDSADAVLDAEGKAIVHLSAAEKLTPGRYAVRCELTDDSGRSVKRVLPHLVEASERPASGLLSLPRFVPQDRPLEFTTAASFVLAEQVWIDPNDDRGRKSFRFVPRDGKVSIVFASPGWYTLTAGKEQTDVFAHGGTDHPSRTLSKQQEKLLNRLEQKPDDEDQDDAILRARGWVDLTADEEHRHAAWPHDRHESHLLALFDRQDVKVGEPLRVLVFVPAKKARLLFTAEGYSVVDYFISTTDGARGHYHVVEIPIKSRQLPHFYLRGRILQAEGIASNPPKARDERLERDRKGKEGVNDGKDPRWCRIDVTDPKALPHGELLRVEVKTDRTDYKPGAAVGVHLKVRDREGKPASAEVSLAAVDAGVYAFGEDRLSALASVFDDPHPAERFQVKTWRSSVGNRWAVLPEVLKMQDGARVLKEQAAMKAEGKEAKDADRSLARLPDRPLPDGEMPIATVPLSRLRTDFRETAVWLPQLRTGADGELRTSFKLPDSLTRYRLSAVALTKSANIGTARTEITASLPLAVQLILPRFAVEGDRVAAVGVLHNHGPKDRVCTVTWTVTGGTLDGPLETVAGWKQDGDRATGTITVPARKSLRIGVWLKCTELGAASVKLHCEDGADGDAETRALPVQPLGRERAVSLDGAFTGSTKVRLPVGFTARDVRVVLSRSEVARSLDGVAGLVDYPHGCVEQTMSRFLPAVLVREAARRGPLALPPDIEAKLPQVLEQGLSRLYKFQHADGGWGWWEQDRTDPRMTAYVVYGLARCSEAGVKIDADAMSRGAAWLGVALRDGRVPTSLVPRAWLALAHAGAVDVKVLRPVAEKMLADGTLEARCLLALACRIAGVHDVANRLWATARDWQPATAEEMALLLKAQMLFTEPLASSRRTAGRLVKERVGLGWDSTQATSAAIDALSLLIPQLAADTPPKTVRIAFAGKPAVALTKADELKVLTYRAHISGDRVPRQDPLEIDLVAEGGADIYYTVEALGTQRQDKVEPIGNAIRLSRSYETLDGVPLEGKLLAGQTFAVRVRVELEKPRDYLLIEDRRPSGCEFADDRLHGKAAADLANVEFRDDRVCAFAASLAAGRHEFVYYLRAETPGVMNVLPGCAYPMYEDRLRGETGAARLEIKPAERR